MVPEICTKKAGFCFVFFDFLCECGSQMEKIDIPLNFDVISQQN